MSLYGDKRIVGDHSDFMIRFNLFGFQVGVQGWFWLTAFLLGGGLRMRSASEWPEVALAVGVIFVSILVHELGHALAARYFGQQAAIYFHGLGGLTHFQGGTLGRWRHAMVVAAGPAASLSLAVLFALWLPWRDVSPWVDQVVSIGLWVNVVWTMINCLPILPMDGGQLLRDILGEKHERLCCGIGGILAVMMVLLALISGFYFMAVLMGFLAWSNFKGAGTFQGGVSQA
ncbi:MAG: metalloprotease [Candidatus Methylacidiphilales bacterium]